MMILWSIRNDLDDFETSLMIESEELLGLWDNDENPYDCL